MRKRYALLLFELQMKYKFKHQQIDDAFIGLVTILSYEQIITDAFLTYINRDLKDDTVNPYSCCKSVEQCTEILLAMGCSRDMIADAMRVFPAFKLSISQLFIKILIFCDELYWNPPVESSMYLIFLMFLLYGFMCCISAEHDIFN